MSLDTLFAFSMFALATTITPGPNNLMLLASGVNFGFKSSIPHMLGICAGFCLMVFVVGIGLAEIFTQLPWLYSILKWVGAIYLLYLAWRIATSDSIDDTSSNGRVAKPISFFSAAAFQWVNPKAWVMAMGAFTTYVPASSGAITIASVAILFAVINVPSAVMWTLFGAGLRHVLRVKRNLRIFNYTAAALLVASFYPLLHDL